MKKVLKWFFISLWLLSTLAITTIAIVSEARDRSENIRILEHGARSSGTVTSKTGGDSYQIIYSFSIPGDYQVSNRMNVNYELYEKLEVEGPLDIAYDSANPDRNYPVEQGSKSVGGIAGDAFGIFFFVAEFSGFFWLILHILTFTLGEHFYKKFIRNRAAASLPLSSENCKF